MEATRIIGFQWSPKSHSLKEFLSGNLHPYIWMDIETNSDSEKYLTSANLSRDDLPVVVLKDGGLLREIQLLAELADRVGLQQRPLKKCMMFRIIGAGPAGLAASVYGSCEGLRTLLIERRQSRRTSQQQCPDRKLPGISNRVVGLQSC